MGSDSCYGQTTPLKRGASSLSLGLGGLDVRLGSALAPPHRRRLPWVPPLVGVCAIRCPGSLVVESYPRDSPSGPRNRLRLHQTHCLTCLGHRDDMSHTAVLDVPHRRPLDRGTDRCNCHLDQDTDHRDQGTGRLDLGSLGTSRSNWACLAPPGIERQGRCKHWGQLRQKRKK